MVGIGDTYVRSGVGRNVSYYVFVTSAVLCVKLKINIDVGVDFFKILDCFVVNRNLGSVGIVFCPKRYFDFLAFVKRAWNLETSSLGAAVATRKREY